MEGEREERGESTESLSQTTPAQTDTLTQGRTEEGEGPRGPSGENGVDSQGQGEEDQSIGDTVASPQETLTDSNSPDDAGGISSCPLPTQGEEVAPSPCKTQSGPPEPCWYCLRSLDPDYRPQAPNKEDSDPASLLPPSGQKVSYQTDPRPHFGVAWSSHSPCRPLWGSEGPCWGQRHQDMPNQMHTCPHCHLGLPPDTLRWHEAKCLLFDGLRNSNK